MGREAEAYLICTDAEGTCQGQGKIILEPHEIILRGAVRRRIARSDLTGFHGGGDDLVMTTAAVTVRAALGAAQVTRWLAALAKPLPSLREKLGIGEQGIRVIGLIDIPDLSTATAEHIRDTSPLMIAQITAPQQMTAILRHLDAHPAPQFWAVVAKGKTAQVSDADVRAQMRAAGYIDSKSCAVPPNHSATRYGRRK